MVIKRYPGRGSGASRFSQAASRGPDSRTAGRGHGCPALRAPPAPEGLPSSRLSALPPARSLTRSAGRRAPGSSAAASRRVPGSAGSTAPSRPAAPRGPARPRRQLAPRERPDGGGHAPGRRRRRTCWRGTRAAPAAVASVSAGEGDARGPGRAGPGRLERSEPRRRRRAPHAPQRPLPPARAGPARIPSVAAAAAAAGGASSGRAGERRGRVAEEPGCRLRRKSRSDSGPAPHGRARAREGEGCPRSLRVGPGCWRLRGFGFD